MRRLVFVALVASAAPAFAHHRQSPLIIPLTTSGDVSLPRVPASGKKMIVVARPKVGGGHAIVGYTPIRPSDIEHVLFSTGDNGGPSVSSRGLTVAWDSDADPLGNGAPGRQILINTKGSLAQVAIDPTGTSVNPA